MGSFLQRWLVPIVMSLFAITLALSARALDLGQSRLAVDTFSVDAAPQKVCDLAPAPPSGGVQHGGDVGGRGGCDLSADQEVVGPAAATFPESAAARVSPSRVHRGEDRKPIAPSRLIEVPPPRG